MTYEKTNRNKASEKKRVAKANQPRAKYQQARGAHLREMIRLAREIYRQYLLIRQAKLAYKLEKRWWG